MNNLSKTALVSLLAFSCGLSCSAHADETLWDLNFKHLGDGKPLEEVPYSPGCEGPQKVIQTDSDSLVGAKKVGKLSPALLFAKKTTANYTPAFTLKAAQPITSGVVTVTFDITFDELAPSAKVPVETLISVPFMNGQGVAAYSLVFVSEGSSNVLVAGSGIMEGSTRAPLKIGEIAHIKLVLDLDQHTFQAFLNNTALAVAEPSTDKFSGFLGLTIRDGTALGGNKGATFAAGIADLVVKVKK